MSPNLFEYCCMALNAVAYGGMQSRDISNGQIKDLLQGLALSTIFAVGKIIITHRKGLSLTIATAITFTPFAINRLVCLAQKQNYLSSDEREVIERNLTRWLDIIRIVSSIAMLILLALQAEQLDILYFGLAVLGVGVDSCMAIC